MRYDWAIWYDLVERSGHMMRSSSMNSKAMEWICHSLKESLKHQKSVLREMENKRIGYIATYNFHKRNSMHIADIWALYS